MIVNNGKVSTKEKKISFIRFKIENMRGKVRRRISNLRTRSLIHQNKLSLLRIISPTKTITSMIIQTNFFKIKKMILLLKIVPKTTI